MKRSEVLEKYRDKIEAAMVSNYRTVLESYGRVQESIYIWDDGEIVEHEDVEGGNSWLEPTESADREFFFVDTIKMPFYDPWDGAIDAPPEDEEEREHMEKEIIDYEVEEYESALSDYIYDEMIAEAKQDEKYYDA